MSLNLTREGIIEEHRKMWRWIAENGWEEYKKSKSMNKIKDTYFQKHGYGNSHIRNRCFLCDYVFNTLNTNCYNCPMDWECTIDLNSPYKQLIEKILYMVIRKKEFKKLALEIANLPERKEK